MLLLTAGTGSSVFTMCSNAQCRAVYTITSQHLRLAMGMVRCPRCKSVFNALATIRHPTDDEIAEVELITRQLPYAQYGDRLVVSHRTASRQAWYKRYQEATTESEKITSASGSYDGIRKDTAPLSHNANAAQDRDHATPATKGDLDVAISDAPGEGKIAALRSGQLALFADLILAFRNVTRQRRRSAIGLSAIVFGVVAAILAGGFVKYSIWALREATVLSRLGHVQVVKRDYYEFGISDPFAYLVPQSVSIVEELESWPEVQVVAPRVAFSGLIAFGDISVSFSGDGVDPQREQIASSELNLVHGRHLSPDVANGVVLGTGLAANLGVKPGDTVVLLATTEAGAMNAVEAEVQGTFRTSKKAYDDVALRIPLDLARSLLQASGTHKWVMLLQRTELTDQVINQLRQKISAQHPELQVIPWYDLADFYNKTEKLLSAQMLVVQIVIAIIIVVSISNTLAMSVTERTAEIGTLMALGLRKKRILKLFLNEGVVMGVVGGVIGVVLGLILAKILSAIGIPMPPPPGTELGFTAEVMVTFPLVLGALVLAVMATLLASVYPARKASNLQIVDALRHSR